MDEFDEYLQSIPENERKYHVQCPVCEHDAMWHIPCGDGEDHFHCMCVLETGEPCEVTEKVKQDMLRSQYLINNIRLFQEIF